MPLHYNFPALLNALSIATTNIYPLQQHYLQLQLQVQGFWGDIACSPYFALGIDADTPNKHAEGLFEILNKVRRRKGDLIYSNIATTMD